MLKIKIRKGDKVIVITGKDKGKQGEVIRVFPKINKAIVSGVNNVYRHTKASQNAEGGIITKEAPINISNLAILDPVSGKPTKVGFRFLSDGRKIRYAKSSGKNIDKEEK